MRETTNLHRRRMRAVEQLLSVLPEPAAAEIRPVLDPRVPDPEGVVLYLLTPEERAAALAHRGGRPADDPGGVAAALLQSLLPLPPYEEALRIARNAFLRGRTDWLRFALGRMPGREPPDVLLPLHPEVVYRGRGFRSFGEFLLPERDPPGSEEEERYWSFESARTFVRSRGLLDQKEWIAFSRGDLAESVGRRPEGIPACPHHVFQGRYSGIRSWIGAPNDRPVVPGYPPIKKARRLVWTLRFDSVSMWRDWVRGRRELEVPRPGNLPALPETFYTDCWRGMDAWLGLRSQILPSRPGRMPFAKARRFVRSLCLRDAQEWQAYVRGEFPDLPPLPEGIPTNPDTGYEGQGYKGFGDWLGTDRVSNQQHAWRPFEEARAFARSLELSGGDEWREWAAAGIPGKPPRPPDIPALPHRSYEDAGWTDWGDFLGTGNVHPSRRVFRDFVAAREFARSLGLANTKEWRALTRGEIPAHSLPPDVPTNPDIYYRDRGWTDWGDFLGTGNVHGSRMVFRSYRQARAFVRKLDVSSVEWRLLCRGELPGKSLPPDIPHNPDVHYRGRGWVDWPDFLGSHGRRHRPKRNWMPFREARRFVRSLRLLHKADYRAWLDGEKPDLPPPPGDLPRAPQVVYRKHGFKDWWDFLGRRPGEQNKVEFRPFREARRFARSLELPGKDAWAAWCAGRREGPARPPDVPASPDKTYRDCGWAGWRDFLGTASRTP